MSNSSVATFLSRNAIKAGVRYGGGSPQRVQGRSQGGGLGTRWEFGDNTP